MDTKLQLVLIIGTLLFAGILLYYLVTKKLHLKYCLIWILAIICFVYRIFRIVPFGIM